MTLSMVVYTVHVTCQDIDGGATRADGGASAPVHGPQCSYTTVSMLISSYVLIMYCSVSRLSVLVICCL